ncbi:hypothetical protein VCSRO173_3479 [Vibrio cholerae]|nr:hypothetical protein VCSRO173_3479 [Vibrio cholerae]
MKRTLVLGASIIAASAIIGLDKINDIRQFGNVIELTSGKVRLGEVYRETLSSTYEVTFVGDDRPTTSVQSKKWTPLVGHISSFLKWLTQLMLRIFAYRSRPHQE